MTRPRNDPAEAGRKRELRAAAADFRGALARLDAELAGLDVPADAGRSAAGRSATSPIDASCKALLAVVGKRCPACSRPTTSRPATSRPLSRFPQMRLRRCSSPPSASPSRRP